MTLDGIQTLMDAGMSAIQIAKRYGVHPTKIIRTINRNNLEWYVAFDENIESNARFWFYDNTFKVFKSEYGYESKEECIRDAIGEFIRQYDPDEITIRLLKENRHIEQYSYEVYGSLPKMYKYYGIDKTAVEYAMSKRRSATAALGHEFQRLLKEVYDEIPLSRFPTSGYGESIPDFISGNTWIDAKLSRSTALNRGCETIDKYRKHTEYLVIIYALHDTEQSDDRAKFVHISELKPLVPPHLQRKIDDFIRKATEVKFGCK